MKFIHNLVIGTWLLASTVISTPILPTTNEAPEFELVERGATFAITGVRGSGVQPRLEIRTMERDEPYAFNLFLLALANFKSKSQDEKLSYYQIAGIHGVPNIPWDGVGRNPKSFANNQPTVGYCTHNSNLFPAWHRPYVALFEQVFYQVAQETARQFKGAKRAKYMKIAKTMRFPYWDWAIDPPKGGNNMPTSIVDQHVNLDTPHGRKTIINPLHGYDFHPFKSSMFLTSPWDHWRRTLRQPNTAAPGAMGRPGYLLEVCNNERATLKSSVYYLFTHKMNWHNFANAHTNGQNSIEAIHNIVHGMVGGGGASGNDGHMTVLWYSAFDPVFWLHHTNVDRIIALWQRTHPDEWVTKQVASQSTFTIAKGSTQGLDSPLTPFHRNTNGEFWTSRTVRDWSQFGYTYPEFRTTDGSAGAIRKIINEKYGNAASIHAAKRSLIPSPLFGSITNANGSFYEYMANIVTPHNSLNGSYGVYIFLGDPPSNVTDWPTASNMVGSNFVFAAPNAAEMGNSNVTGSVSLTQALTKVVGDGALGNLAVDMVVPYLQSQLQWHVAQNGVEVDPSQLPGLQVSVISAELTPPATEYDFPTWGAESVLMNVTHGKPGGLSVPATINGLGQEIIQGIGSILGGLGKDAGEIGNDITGALGSIGI